MEKIALLMLAFALFQGSPNSATNDRDYGLAYIEAEANPLANKYLPYEPREEPVQEFPERRIQLPREGNTREYVDPPQFRERREDSPLQFPMRSPNDPPQPTHPLHQEELELETTPGTPLKRRFPEHVNPPRYEQWPGETPSRSPIPREMDTLEPPTFDTPLPEQGYSPEYKYPQRSMQTQHHNRFMTNPQ